MSSSHTICCYAMRYLSYILEVLLVQIFPETFLYDQHQSKDYFPTIVIVLKYFFVGAMFI